MYATLLTKISDTLDQVTKVKDHFSAPKANLTQFPCVFYKPLGFENAFETQNENNATYRFLMIVMVGKGQITAAQAFSYLAGTVDDIIAQFDQDWNKGTIDGHRVWVKIDSGDEWQISEEQEGLIAYAPLNVEFKLLTSN